MKSNSQRQAKSCYGLVVGIGGYGDKRISPLSFTSNDARSFYDLLIDPKRAAFPKENVKLLLDDEATRFHIEDAISGWLFEHSSPDSTVVIFFAGHGGTEPDKTQQEVDGVAKYLLPWDTNKDNLFASAISTNKFSELLKTVAAKRQVIFLDACHSGGVVSKGARDIGVDPYAHLAQGEGRLMIAAAKANQLSYEVPELGHGIFTHHLLEALQGAADYNGDGQVTALEVFRYLQEKVPQTAREMARSHQEPLLQGDAISQDITLTVDAAALARRDAERARAEEARRMQLSTRSVKLTELTHAGEMPLAVAQEGLALLTSEPGKLSEDEQTLRDLLLSVLDGHVSSASYLKARERIRIEPVPVPPALQFCINCGAKLKPGLSFCMNCGVKLTR